MLKKSNEGRTIVRGAGEGIRSTSASGDGGEASLDDVGDGGRGGVLRCPGAGDGEEEEGLDIGGEKGASWDVFPNHEMGGELTSNQTRRERPESVTRKSRDFDEEQCMGYI